MTLAFQPQTEEEVLNLLQPDIYDFKVEKAEDGTSKKSGNPMITLTLVLWDKQGRERYVYDYLLTNMMYKIKHFCDSTGLQDKYQSGNFGANDCIGRSGKCKLIIQESDGYPPKNAVQDYLKVMKVIPNEVKNDFKDDEIPW